MGASSACIAANDKFFLAGEIVGWDHEIHRRRRAIKKRPARSKREPWQGQKNPPGQSVPSSQARHEARLGADSPGACKSRSSQTDQRGARVPGFWRKAVARSGSSAGILQPVVMIADQAEHSGRAAHDIDRLSAPGDARHLPRIELGKSSETGPPWARARSDGNHDSTKGTAGEISLRSPPPRRWPRSEICAGCNPRRRTNQQTSILDISCHRRRSNEFPV